MLLHEVADKVSSKVEYLIKCYYPKPSCSNKHKQWAADIEKIKRLVASKLGVNGIEIKINL